MSIAIINPEAVAGRSARRVLIIGVGSIGERHLRSFQAFNNVQVAACESNAELGHAISAKYACPWFSSLDAAFKSGQFDAAVVCTPANAHTQIATACVERGLHVLIEKPLAVSLDGLEELQRMAVQCQRVARVAYVHHSMLLNLRLRELLQSGIIGEPKHVTMVAGQHFPSFRPAYRTIYYNDHSKGGGAIQDALTHSLNLVEWLISPICSVFADASHQVLEGVAVEDTVNLVARLAGGVQAAFTLNQFQAPNEFVLSVHGHAGSLRAELHRQRVGIFQHGDDDWNWEQLPSEHRDQSFIRQAGAFLAAINGEGDLLATLGQGIQSLRVNLAALESADTGAQVLL